MVHVQVIADKAACRVIVNGVNMNNYWGPQDDEEPLPAWMDPKTYREGGAKFKGLHNKSLEDAAADILKKPLLNQIPDREPNV